MNNKPLYLKIVLLLFLCFSIFIHPVIMGATAETTAGEDTLGISNSISSNMDALGLRMIPPPLTPDYIIQTGSGICYSISEEFGFLYSNDSGKTWEERNSGLPLKLIYPFQKSKTRYLTSLGVDPLNLERVAITTTNCVYISEDYGKNWTKIGTNKPVPGGTYLTAVALSPIDKNTILIGTSYDGIFESKDQGRTWSKIPVNLSSLYKGAQIWEEITAIAYHPTTGQIVFACGYPGTSVTPSLYLLAQNRKSVQKINLRGLRVNESGTQKSAAGETIVSNETETIILTNNQIENEKTQNNSGQDNVDTSNKDINQVIKNLYFKSIPVSTAETQNQNSWFLQASTKNASWLYPWFDESGPTSTGVQNSYSLYACLEVENSFITDAPVFNDNTLEKIERMRRASGKYGIYVRSDYALGNRLDEQFSFVKKNGFNSIVVDLKDDNGFLTYNSKLPMAQKIGSLRKNSIKIEELLKKAKDNGIYVIGRLVVFKDERLYRYQNYLYAIWNKVTNRPWESWNKKEFWVDPYSEDVWDYNIAIAEELQNLGVDEIQFDYIRFPTDGEISQAKYRYKPADNGLIQAEKKDAIESFLTKARERISIPISADLYGFNCWCRMNSINGQNVELISKFVDVICPMYYPSHFPKAFLKDIAYLERAKVIYQDGTFRAKAIVDGRSLIRPYVQSFLLGGETKMTAPSYTKYLINQLEGVFAAPEPGFTLWNYGMNYFMVKKEVSDYLLRKRL